MSWTARKPVFERTIDFLIELPLGIVELILKMCMDRSNCKALRYAIGSGSTSAVARNQVLHLIDRITTNNEFLREQLTFDIQLDHMIEENTTHGNREWCRHKFLRYQEEHDQVKYIMFGYKRLRNRHVRKRPNSSAHEITPTVNEPFFCKCHISSEFVLDKFNR